MHVISLNYFYDRSLTGAAELLDRYETLTGWAEGLARAGAAVTVVQRFTRDAEIVREGIRYLFVRDPARRPGGILDAARRVNQFAARLRPDLVHIHGLTFARQARRLQRRLPQTPILIQDHANHPPCGWLRHVTLRRALRQAQGVSFSAQGLAQPWITAGLISTEMPVFELMEGSSRFQMRDRISARRVTGLTGSPLCLWVGRLDSNKDPLTVLNGFASVLGPLPEARLVMAYGEAGLLPEVTQWLRGHPEAAQRVTLAGRLPHVDMEAIYNSADFFLLGSHHEGSGYAVLEALACGVVPIVTDIPSFRRLLLDGEIGGLWPIGDSAALAQNLLEWHARLSPRTPSEIRPAFEDRWSFEATGRQAMRAYAALIERGTK